MSLTAPSSFPLTARGFLEGARLIGPLLPGTILFGVAVGAAGAQKGLTLAELTVMNAFVYAGAAQLIALGLWQEQWTWPALVTIALVTLTVNARLMLMSAALRPWISTVPARWAYFSLYFLTDANYAVGQRYYDQGRRDVGVFLGGGVTLWMLWVTSPILGYLGGKFVADPRGIGLDLVMPIIFTAIAARTWRDRRDSLAWLAAGLVGFTLHRLFGGSIHVVIGALAGMAVAAALARKPDSTEGAA